MGQDDEQREPEHTAGAHFYSPRFGVLLLRRGFEMGHDGPNTLTRPTCWRRYHSGVVASTLLLSSACSPTADARPQLLFVVDTDLPLVTQVADDAELSADATVDTLRVDVLGSSGDVVESRLFVLPSHEDWPMSFGVVPETGAARVRFRLFRGALATSGLQSGTATLEPPARMTVDRLVEARPPDEGIRRVSVVLRGDCMGIPSTFGAAATTCIDAASPSGDPASGTEGASGPTFAGSWPRARSEPCASAPADDRVCIAGGFSVMGDPMLSGVEDGKATVDAAPVHPVILSPFWLDRTELSVGRLRAAVASGAFQSALPTSRSDNPDCTWLGPNDPSNDQLPVNCIPFASARAACQALGGDLPSEAQFEHAARGRGERRTYPWGNSLATCCTAALSRKAPGQMGSECDGPMLDPVGSNLPTLSCGSLGDQSRDGVMDLGGNVAEYVLDLPVSYQSACWSDPGIPRDPVCSGEPSDGVVIRGGFAIGGFGNAAGANRGTGAVTGNRMEGLRCAYAD